MINSQHNTTNLYQLLSLIDKHLGITHDEDYWQLISTEYIAESARELIKKEEDQSNPKERLIAERHFLKVLSIGLSKLIPPGEWSNTLSANDIQNIPQEDKDILLSSSTSLGLLYEEFVRSIHEVADSIYKQLTDAFIWGVPAAFLLVRKDIFVCGELDFNANSIVFIPQEEEMAFPNHYIDGTWWISRPIGGLAANAPSSKERFSVLKSVSDKGPIQIGMSALQKFIYNIDSVGKAKSGYLHIFKNKIEDVYLDSSAIFVKSGGDNIMFGSTAVHYTQKECKENIAKWKSGNYETIGKSLPIPETIAPKILLDNVLKGRAYSNQEINDFLQNEIYGRTFYALYKGLTPQLKTTFQERAHENAPKLLEPLKDIGYMNSLETLGEKKTEGCFIASVAFSDYAAPQVIVLRRYRDETLVRTSFGRRFIRGYYRHGPSLALLLKRHRIMKNVVAWTLNIIVWFIVTIRR